MKRIIAIMTAVALSLFVPVTLAQADEACPPGVVVVGDGVGPQGAQGMASVWANTFVQTHQDWPVEHLDYSPDSSDAQNRVGIDLFKTAYRDHQKQCPDAVVYGIGHSAGAMALGDAAAELQVEGTDLADLRLDLISDPMRPGNQQGKGFKLVMPLPLPGIKMPVPPRGSTGAAVVRYTCNENDLICNSPDPVFNPVIINRVMGYFGTSHKTVEVAAVMPPAQSEDVLHVGR